MEVTVSSLSQPGRMAGDQRNTVYQYSKLSGRRKVLEEINKLPHKVVLNVDKVAKEVGSARVANIVLLDHYPILRIDYTKIQIASVKYSAQRGCHCRNEPQALAERHIEKLM